MSDAYEKALEAVHKENEKRIGRLDIRTVVEIYLAALPPSIVVDGRGGGRWTQDVSRERNGRCFVLRDC